MSFPRFFVDERCEPDAVVPLDEQDISHASTVLRLKTGDRIGVVNAGRLWDARMEIVTRRRATARIVSELPRDEAGRSSLSELPVSVTVLQALLKGNKLDFVTEKVVELGAGRVVPVRCERSYGDASSAKLARWRRIARSAAQQSRRLIVPEIDPPMAWSEALQRFAPSALVLVAHASAARRSLAGALGVDGDAQHTAWTSRDVVVATGPEGDFTDEELKTATAMGCRVVSLGPTILRAETAAAVLMAAVAALRGWW
jgi:16S rRNA (uracil1498-N3)-methyltransferase